MTIRTTRHRLGTTSARLVLLLLAHLCAGEAAASPQEQDDRPQDVRLLYRQACAACHGTDGSGISPDSPLYASFQAPPADLSDPLFNSREPAADWFYVVKYGGAAMGLSGQMPAFDEALTDEQIDALVEFIKGFADTDRYPPGELNFVRPIDTIKAFPEDELIVESRYEARPGRKDGLQNVLEYARRVGRRSHAEIKVVHTDEADGSMLEAVELGFKWAFFDDLERELLLTAGLESEIPVEGDGSVQLVPYFSWAKGLTEEFTLQGTLRSHLPVDDIDEGDAKLSAIVHWIPTPWPRGVFPGLEWTLTAPFSEQAEWESTVVPQLYFGLNRRGHVAFTVGVELPLTDLDYDYRVRAFWLWDLADGAPWEGW